MVDLTSIERNIASLTAAIEALTAAITTAPPTTTPVRKCGLCGNEIRTSAADGFYDHVPGCLDSAMWLPLTKDGQCAAGCGHVIAVHRTLGCGVLGCDCQAPHGRILPQVEQ